MLRSVLPARLPIPALVVPIVVAVLAGAAPVVASFGMPGGPDEPLRIVGPELEKLDFTRTDGGLPLAPGAQTFVVIRADRDHPERSDGRGWTYHHHPGIACWKGRLYVAWDSCERDEDTWPSHELYSTSTDGEHWSAPAELFPQGVSTPLRMYFFHAPNGRMLALAGLRVGHEKTKENTKGPLVVREIRPDQSLGGVYTLRPPENPIPDQPPGYARSEDTGFREACRQLLADHLFLEQQDYGNLLPPSERIRWHDRAAWAGDEAERKAAASWGKALTFFRRADGVLVGIAKNRWVTLSKDDGKTWSQPVRPPTLVSGMGKVWAQRAPDGRYLLVYDPHIKIRYPLVVVTSQDGITFRDMRVLHGELPPRRYPMPAKTSGASYARGLSAWTDDGSRKDRCVWIVYSVNTEEIRITKLP